MKPKTHQIATVLAFIIGAMAIFAGGQVLLGKDPGYYVISWLPIYNFVLGVISALITADLYGGRVPTLSPRLLPRWAYIP